MPDLEFYICGMVGRHLTRAHLYVRQGIRRNIHKGLNLSCDNARRALAETTKSRVRKIQFQNSFSFSNCLRIILRAVI
jgi:hypothetical protein